MSLILMGRNSTLLLLFLFTSLSIRVNDFFERIYSEINTNIENGDFEANFTLINGLEAMGDFQKLDCLNKGKVYHKIGVSHYLNYQEVDAIGYYGKVLRLWEGCSAVHKSEVANTIYNLGVCHRYLGNFQEAKTFLDQALAIFENTTDYPRYELGLKYHGIGQFYESIGDRFRAQLHLSNAINLFEKESAVLEHFEVLNSSITLHMDFRDYGLASEYASRALDLASANPNKIPPDNLVPVYLNAAAIAFEESKYLRAENLAKEALNLTDRDSNPQLYATGLEILVFLNMERKNFIKAEELLCQVLEIREQFSHEGSGFNEMALTHENFAELYLQQGALRKANEQLGKGFRIVAPNMKFDARMLPTVSNIEIKDENTFIRLMELKTRIFENQYENSGNLEWLQHSLDVQHKIDSVIKRGLASFQFERSKLDFLNIRFKHYGEAVKDALRLYELTNDRFYLQEAYQFSAMTKALVLQQELNRVNALRMNVSGKILKKEEELRNRMNERRSLLSEATLEQRDSILQVYIMAQNELDYFLSDIEKNEPTYYQERYRFLNIPSVSEIQKKLPEGLAVIEFFVAENQIYIFWITSQNFLVTTAIWDDQLKTAIHDFTDYCSSPGNSIDPSTVRLVYDRLLGEGLKKLEGVQRLCFIPDGDFHSISFEALKNHGKYLIEEYAISYSYAAALLVRNREDGKTPVLKYLGFGSEYSDSLNARLKVKKRFFGEQGLSRLTLSQSEIEGSAALYEGRVFLNQEATLENFFEHADDAEIVHLSLHGLVDSDDPDRSCIIFNDSNREFLLSPPDLYKNRLKANLVLLSACQSASGKIYKGEGVQGMSKAFLLAGAHNVLSSLWNASESSSLSITQSFLRHTTQNIPYDIALQKAKLHYLNSVTPSQQHPYYWGNFILLGKVEPMVQNSWFFPLMAGVSLVIIGLLIFFKRRIKRT